MYIDVSNHGEEAKTFFAMDMHRMQFVVIENSIIYTLWTCAVVIYLFICFRTTWDWRIQAQIPLGFSINTTPVGWGGAVGFAVACFFFAAGNRTTPFSCVFCGHMPQFTMRYPAWHKGVPSVSICMLSGIEEDLPLFVFKSMKGKIFQSWRSW